MHPAKYRCTLLFLQNHGSRCPGSVRKLTGLSSTLKRRTQALKGSPPTQLAAGVTKVGQCSCLSPC